MCAFNAMTDKPMTQHIVILDRKDTEKKTVTILY